MRSLLVVGSITLASVTLRAYAQVDAPPSADPAVREALRTLDAESTADDPLGVGDLVTLRDVRPPTRPTPSAEPFRVPAEAGEELSAIPGVREVAHRVHVRFVEGLALVEHLITLTSRAAHHAEARLRLPRPADAWLVEAEVCALADCVRGAPDRSTRYDAALVAEAFGPASGPSIETPSTPSTPSTPNTQDPSSEPSAASVGALYLAADAHVDARGPAFSVHVAPLRPGETLHVRLSYAAHLNIHGGAAHLRIPPRGNDLRAVSAAVRFEAEDMLAPSLRDAPSTHAVEVEPWASTDLTARLPSGALHARAYRFPCGPVRCVAVGLDAGSRLGEPEHVTLLLDVSPSTFGPARGRLAPTLAALLSSLPPRSDVRAVAFAARAETLVATATPAAELPVSAMTSATALDLGGATRLDAALVAAGSTAHAIVIGDGGLTEGPDLEAALSEAQTRGMRLSVVSLTGRSPRPALARAVDRLGGRVLVLDDEAFAPQAEGDLYGRVASLFSPRLGIAMLGPRPLGEIHAGEALRFAGPSNAAELRLGRLRERVRPAPPSVVDAFAALGRALAGEPTRLAYVSDASARTSRSDRSVSGTSNAARLEVPPAPRSDAPATGLDCDALTRAGPTPQSRLDPWMLADVRSCALPSAPPAAAAELGRGIPAETVLSMLRRRVVPVARGCFRRDRAGREDYATRAVFELRLTDREVSYVDVQGEIADDLRQCLLRSVDDLDIPDYAGTIVVRYPLYTQAYGPSVQIELHPDVAGAVDRAIPLDP